MMLAKVGGPKGRPGDKTLKVSDIAEALAPIAPDVEGTIQRIRHWTREGLMLPVDVMHEGPGKHRQYAADAVYDAAVLQVMTNAGLSVNSVRHLVEALKRIRSQIPKWKKDGRPFKLVISRTAVGLSSVELLTGKDNKVIIGVPTFKLADVVMTIHVNLGKLFVQVKVPQ
jgi:DNA-binding transcriptional MerR regulator